MHPGWPLRFTRPRVGSGGGAVPLRVRCVYSARFRGGAQSGSHRSVSTPCPPNRTCGFPASGSPVGSCRSHTERRFGVTPAVPVVCVPPASRSCTASPARCPSCRVHGTGRASRVAAPSIFHACRRQYPGGNRPVCPSLSSRPADGLPLFTGGSAPASCVSRPARRSLAFRPAWSLSRPRRPFYQSASAHVVTSMNRPGRYQPERQLLGGIRTHQESAPFHGAL